MSSVDSGAPHAAVLLDPDQPEDQARLARLRADANITVLDQRAGQREQLGRLRPTPDAAVLSETERWAYFPWRRTVVATLGPRGFRALRLDRNRNLITAAEQDRLGSLRIGVAGLSVGHVIAHTIAAQGACGELRLADFDTLELSNLNRVPANLFDIGVNKAVVAARRIAELDPYVPIRVLEAGLTHDTMDEFLDGLDIVIEECDSLEMKVFVREGARRRGIPVLMATSDRGLVDVERFDLDPHRPILHGLLGDLDLASLPGMSSRDKVPHVLRILETEPLSPRMAASMVEVERSISTWPQLAGDVALGATALAEVVRRIGLGEAQASGRIRIDVAAALDALAEPELGDAAGHLADGIELDAADLSSAPSEDAVPSVIAAAAIRAPSGGNVQPWRVEVDGGSVTIHVAPQFTSAMDVDYRGSAVALGAALFNARVAAAAHGRLGPVTIAEGGAGIPPSATLSLGTGDDPELADQYGDMLARSTNRHPGEPNELAAEAVSALLRAATRHDARLSLLTSRADIDSAATIFAAADRARYLTARLHTEMISELRWPGDADPDAGIDVNSLGLDAEDFAVLGILRRPEVMAHLADWDAGSALGDATRDRVNASSALAVISVAGQSVADYVRGGSAMEAVWVAAERHGLGVQPVSPVFLYARNAADLEELSPSFSEELAILQSRFQTLTGTEDGESQILVLRLSVGAPEAVRSRRSLERVAHRRRN